MIGYPATASARDIAAAIRAGHTSPVDLMAETLSRIADLDPHLHAFHTVDAARALAEARRRQRDVHDGRPLGPLHGVPFAVKDMIDLAGLPTTCQSRVLDAGPARRDALVVRRLRRAGAIPIGKLTMEEFGIGSADDDDAEESGWPFARNPWNIDRTAGGSSSGCGSAVAARLVPFALGTDTGGSIRCPAAMCGVVGFKPSQGQISMRGVFPLAPTLDHVGVVAATVTDAALIADVVGDRRPLAGGAQAPRSRRPLADVTIGVVGHFHARDVPASPETALAIGEAVGVLADLGARIVDVELHPAQVYQACGSIIEKFEAHAVHQRWWASRAALYGATTRAEITAGASIARSTYAAAQWQRHSLRADFNRRMRQSGARVLLTAVSPGPAWRQGDQRAHRSIGTYALRIPFNVLGVPAMAIPIGFSPSGLPLSM